MKPILRQQLKNFIDCFKSNCTRRFYSSLNRFIGIIDERRSIGFKPARFELEANCTQQPAPPVRRRLSQRIGV